MRKAYAYRAAKNSKQTIFVFSFLEQKVISTNGFCMEKEILIICHYLGMLYLSTYCCTIVILIVTTFTTPKHQNEDGDGDGDAALRHVAV